MTSEVPSDAPVPRLCHLVKWPDFDGYGFNLHAEKAKKGQFIGKVDDDSPADHAGLKEGDRIIEVNGVNIANENHRQVVERIKAVPNETKLLVLDVEADRYYQERKIVVKGTHEYVKYIKTPVPRPTTGIVSAVTKTETPGKGKGENNVTTSQTNGTASASQSETQSLADSSRSSTPKTEPKRDSIRSSPSDSPRPEAPSHVPKAQNGSTAALNNNNGPPVYNGVSSDQPDAVKPTPVKPETKPVVAAVPPKTSATSNGNSKEASSNGAKAPSKPSSAAGGGELNLNMSAAQMREMLANKKKNDPKKQSMDMREKYQIVQQM